MRMYLCSLTLLLAACSADAGSTASSGSAKSGASGSAKPTTSAKPSAAPAATTAAPSASAAAPAGNAAVVATCTTKMGARILSCAEYHGEVPAKAEEECKKEGGTFAAAATPCTSETVMGKCDPKEPGASYVSDYSYKPPVGEPKESCEALGKVWTVIEAKK